MIDEPMLISYAGRYKKNETRSRQSSGGSQTAISQATNKHKIDRPNPTTNRLTFYKLIKFD
ncbi:hypothetical protein LOAG_15075, partial [Loa loa]